MSPRMTSATAIQREVGRLPERLRAAVVLCYFEGRTCEQAADRLNLPVGTIKSRLSGARARLRSRLARGGYGLDTADLAAWPLAGPLVVPERLATSTIASVMASAAGRSASAGVIPSAVIVLTEESSGAMFLSRLKAAAALALAVAAMAWMSAAAAAGGRGTNPLTDRPLPTAGRRTAGERAALARPGRAGRDSPGSAAGSWTRTGGRSTERPSA